MLKLVKSTDSILSTPAIPFDWDNPVMDPHLLENEMIQLMKTNNGIGLAAPQVGINARVLVIMTRHLDGITSPFAIFNPTVLDVSQDELVDSEEGCLSFPNLYFNVKRPARITVEFFDKDKNCCIIKFTGIDAKCIQHEIDHLNGVCFTHKVSKLKLDLAIKKQRKKNGRTK